MSVRANGRLAGHEPELTKEQVAEKEKRLVDIRLAIRALEDSEQARALVRLQLAEADADYTAARGAYWTSIAVARDAGATFEEIGRVLGVTRQRAHALYQQATQTKAN